MQQHAEGALALAWVGLAGAAALSAVLPPLARFGDHGRHRGGGGGGGERWTVPKRCFTHFYVFGAACNGAVLAHRAAAGGDSDGLLRLALFQAHLLRRLYECLAVTRFGAARMHLAGYALGLTHYALATATLALGGGGGGGVPGWRAAAAAAAFAYASLPQHRAHAALAALRTAAGGGGVGLPRYGLPCGGWFDLVASPHYLFEVGVYAALDAAGGRARAVRAMLVWVLVNQAVAADKARTWGRANIAGFPKGRARLFPFAW